jgi:hypothetical protein
MASPTEATMVRLKIAPQRGHAVALTEIMAPHAGHDVILVMALPHASPFVRSLTVRPISINTTSLPSLCNPRKHRAPGQETRELWMSVAVG